MRYIKKENMDEVMIIKIDLASLKAGLFCLKQNYLAPAGNHRITQLFYEAISENKITAYRWALSFKIE